MKNMQKKGFTLVELIVVITILAILGTIAFISLQGYGAEAKNSKVTSDLRNLVSAIETKRTRDAITLGSLVTNTTLSTTNGVDTTLTTGSGVALSAANYTVGNIDFTALGQNGSDFKDPNNGNTEVDYLFATVTGTNANNDSFSSYQLAGQLIENDIKKARVNGSYVIGAATDTASGLLSENGGTTPLTDGVSLSGTNNLY